MKKIIFYVVLLLTIVSCKKQSELSKIYNCKSAEFENLKKISDYNKNFALSIPTNWKTTLYFDAVSSEIHTADTTKQLSKTYILNASYNFGNLKFDADFYKKSDSILAASKLVKLKSGTIQFKNKPAFWVEAKGIKNGFNYHVFNLMVRNSANSYFNASTEIYGSTNIEQRFCESVSILDEMEFLH